MKKFIFFILIFSTALFGAGATIELAGNLNDNAPKSLDHTSLEPISKSTYKVYDPYDKTIFEYEGVLLDELVKIYAKDDTKAIRFSATDGYMIVINRTEWESELILLVIKRDGKLLRSREKGPARIVFPQYSPKNIDKLALFDKWIWMINRVEFQK